MRRLIKALGVYFLLSCIMFSNSFNSAVFAAEGDIPIDSDNSQSTYYVQGGLLNPRATTSNSLYYNANQLGKIYNILPSSGVCPTAKIGIIELGGGYKTTDLTTYWNKIGLPVSAYPIVKDVLIDGAKNNPSDVISSTEVTLDIQMAGGICPGSTINVYFAKNTVSGFYNAIARAISDNCTTISISWGAPESQFGGSYVLNQFDKLFQTAVSKGITICAAAGDNGSTDGTSSNVTDFPASSPNVLACGGTTLICPNGVYDSSTKETVWNNNSKISATGGGYSAVFSAPSYQTANILNFGTKRGVPDVCGSADPNYGFLIYQNGQYYTVGGTSCVSPMWAAYLAHLNLKKFANPSIYSLTSTQKSLGFHDVISGNNGAYNAKASWDPTTGWGSPIGGSSALSGFLSSAAAPSIVPPTVVYQNAGTWLNKKNPNATLSITNIKPSDVKTVDYSVNGGAQTKASLNSSGVFTINNLKDGSYPVTIKVTDINETVYTNTVNVMKDTVTPDINITSTRYPTITISKSVGSSGISKLEISTDNKNFVNMGNSFSSNKQYYFRITNNAGVTSTIPYKFIVSSSKINVIRGSAYITYSTNAASSLSVKPQYVLESNQNESSDTSSLNDLPITADIMEENFSTPTNDSSTSSTNSEQPLITSKLATGVDDGRNIISIMFITSIGFMITLSRKRKGV